LGNVWHGDEMKIKVRGEWRWLWNTMDKKTRFQLASEISKTRKIEDAEAVFRKSKKATKKKTKLVITDGLQAYKGAFKSEFCDPKVSTRYMIKSVFGLNAILERMQGNIRGRERAMRGLKIDETPFFEGHRIYYNFISLIKLSVDLLRRMLQLQGLG
jgi:putative transposase